MKKILISLMIVAAVLAVMGGAIYANFSDTETSNGNSWTAGTLNLVDVISGTATSGNISVNENADGINDNVLFTLVKPGDAGTITWTLTNNGNIGGTLKLDANTTFDQGGAPNEPEAAAETALGGVVGLDSTINVTVTLDGGAAFYTGPLSGVAAALSLQSNAMAGAGVHTYVLSWNVPGSVGNEIQGDTATLNITFTLNQ